MSRRVQRSGRNEADWIKSILIYTYKKIKYTHVYINTSKFRSIFSHFSTVLNLTHGWFS